VNTEPHALNPIHLGGPHPLRLLDRFRPSRLNTTTILHRSFPAHFLEEGGYDIRTVQERLGRKDASATMIFTHVLNRGPAAVRSPADRLAILQTFAPAPPPGHWPAEIACTPLQSIPVRSRVLVSRRSQRDLCRQTDTVRAPDRAHRNRLQPPAAPKGNRQTCLPLVRRGGNEQEHRYRQRSF
jgi:hypothetical protein